MSIQLAPIDVSLKETDPVALRIAYENEYTANEVKKEIKRTAEFITGKIELGNLPQEIELTEDKKTLKTVELNPQFITSYAKDKREDIDPYIKFSIRPNGSCTLYIGNQAFLVENGNLIKSEHIQGEYKPAFFDAHKQNKSDDIIVYKALGAIQAAFTTNTQEKPSNSVNIQGFLRRLLRR